MSCPAVLQAVAQSYVAMQADLRKRGSPLRMFIGEEDCARDKRLPNDGYCHSHTRALSHALLSATTARLGEDFIVGQCPCDQFGATGLQEVWPQASFAHAPESLDALSRRLCLLDPRSQK